MHYPGDTLYIAKDLKGARIREAKTQCGRDTASYSAATEVTLARLDKAEAKAAVIVAASISASESDAGKLSIHK